MWSRLPEVPIGRRAHKGPRGAGSPACRPPFERNEPVGSEPQEPSNIRQARGRKDYSAPTKANSCVSHDPSPRYPVPVIRSHQRRSRPEWLATRIVQLDTTPPDRRFGKEVARRSAEHPSRTVPEGPVVRPPPKGSRTPKLHKLITPAASPVTPSPLCRGHAVHHGREPRMRVYRQLDRRADRGHNSYAGPVVRAGRQARKQAQPPARLPQPC